MYENKKKSWNIVSKYEVSAADMVEVEEEEE